MIGGAFGRGKAQTIVPGVARIRTGKTANAAPVGSRRRRAP
jgi:hypothetical protein